MDESFESQRPNWKLLGLVVAAQALCFSAGIYSGHTFWPKQIPRIIQPNYTTEPTAPATPAPDRQPAQQSNAPNSCAVKGNISGKNKIYHVVGGAFFERTQEEMCFNSEVEAQEAGFIKSSR